MELLHDKYRYSGFNKFSKCSRKIEKNEMARAKIQWGFQGGKLRNREELNYVKKRRGRERERITGSVVGVNTWIGAGKLP